MIFLHVILPRHFLSSSSTLVVPHPVMHLSMSFTVKNPFYELEMKEGIYMTRQTLFRDIFDGLEDILETRHDA